MGRTKRKGKLVITGRRSINVFLSIVWK